jgi:arylsulfatase A-like enzyme
MKMLKTILNAALLGVGMMAGAFCVSVSAAPPNVIIVLTDDQGYGDLSCHGNPVLKTPNLDRLHGDSVRLTNFHVSAVCAPTRAALLSGRDHARVGVWTTVGDRAMMFADHKTLADCFAANGYRTAMLGKWHIGAAPPYQPWDRGFHDVLYQPGGVLAATQDWWNNECWNDTYIRNGKPEKVEGYRTDVWFDEAIRWMTERREKEEPFFLYLATPSPHAPHMVPKKYAEPYKAYDDKSLGAKGLVADHYGMIANIDENMGRLDAFLQESGLRENTMVIFMTDNGGTAGVRIWNAGMKGGKGSSFEGGHRVPCFVRWPAGGLSGGRDVDALALHVDWFPTLAELCGLRTPEGWKSDGMSLSPWLKGSTEAFPQRQWIVNCSGGHYYPEPEKSKWHCAVMRGKWRLIGRNWLYDVEADPAQENNVAKEHPELLKEMRAAYEDYWAEVFPNRQDFRPVRIGAPEDGVVKLTSRDWRSTNDEPAYAQGYVRHGKPARGFWVVDAVSDGVYEFELRRWPKEADTPIRSGLPLRKEKFMYFPPGKALPIREARLQVDDAPVEAAAVSLEDKAIRFRLPLSKGQHRIEATFLDEAGETLCGAYYIYMGPTARQSLPLPRTP